ncbi:Uncharacterised protein [Algoriella xinjiangensis]|uniref:hypothetical protein n=1 Tax=Algoriella xinjiangensis TaxID=684065 RepID=UPI000F6405E9|nr:hypothetical protein [Algoriella xinjiangensis]VDH16097.1 Uncharacterised protein [Algoriella xinjiangensis]
MENRQVTININDTSPLANTAYVDLGKENKVYNKAQVNELIEDAREGTLGSISPSQTLEQLNALVDGNYYAAEAGNYAFGTNVPVGWQYRFNKTGTTWKVLTKVEMKMQDLSEIETNLSKNSNNLNQITNTEIATQLDYKNFTLEAGQVATDGSAYTSINWIKSSFDVTALRGKKVLIKGFGSHVSILNGTIPRFMQYKTTIQTANNKSSHQNDNGQMEQSVVISNDAVLLVVNIDGDTNIGADLPNSIYKTQFKMYEKIENSSISYLNVSQIKEGDRIETTQIKTIETNLVDVSNSKNKYFDGVGFPQYELGQNGDKYFDKSSKQIFIKMNGVWIRNAQFKVYPFVKPTDFTWEIPYKIFQIDNGKFFLDWKGLFVEKVKADYDRLTKYYVDNVNGLDTNNGLMPETAFKTIAYARDTIGARNIILAKGIWLFNECFKTFIDNNSISEPLIVRCLDGKAEMINGYRGSTYTWSASNGCYSTSRTNVVNVLDLTNKDENGVYQNLSKVRSIAECQLTANSWFTDGTLIYIHTRDKRVPDTNIILSFDTQNVYTAGLNVPYVYFENIVSYADNIYNALLFKNNATNQFKTKVYLKSCGGVNNSRGNGLALDNFKEAILEGCFGANVLRDALNYHTTSLSSGFSPSKILEIDCFGYNTGQGSNSETSSNGSTTHEGSTIIRLNSTFNTAKGSVIADVNAGAMSLNLGVESNEDTITDGSGASFRINGAGSKMWIYNAVGYSFNSTSKSIVANTGSLAFYKDTVIPNGTEGSVIEI